jgi:hypothetical protein
VRLSRRKRSAPTRFEPDPSDGVVASLLRKQRRTSLPVAVVPPQEVAASVVEPTPVAVVTPVALAPPVVAAPEGAVVTLPSAVAALLDSRLPPAQRRRCDTRLDAFVSALPLHQMSLATASLEHLLEYCVSLRDNHVRVREIVAFIQALDQRRVLAGGTSFHAHPRYKTAMSRLRKWEPIGRRHASVAPFNTTALVRRVPLDDSFESRRLRVLFLLRFTTLMRPSEPASISRESLQLFAVPGSERGVVGFTYHTKQSHMRNFESDGNHLEFLPLGSAAPRAMCPASALLAWRDFVNTLPGAQAHDSLFVQADGRALSTDSVRRIMTRFMQANVDIVGDAASHELRAHSAMHLWECRVPQSEIHRRAGWHDISENRTLQGNYLRFRLVCVNFAQLLLGSAFNANDQLS